MAFSRKRRGFCPSCGGRRMAETSALLVHEVLPGVPLRQWVLSLPFALRYLLATRPEVLTRVLGIVYRVISGHLIRKAGRTGNLPEGDPDDPADAETIFALAQRKNGLFQRRLDADGVEVFESDQHRFALLFGVRLTTRKTKTPASKILHRESPPSQPGPMPIKSS